MPKAVVFDMDETLAESKRPVTNEMASALAHLLTRVPVAVISGGKREILVENLVSRLPEDADLSNLYLLPTCGAALYTCDDLSHPVYEERLTDDEMERIEDGIRRAIEATNLIDLSTPSFGERIERRISQVTLSARGQSAPLREKLAWDPDRMKRPVLRDAIAKELPEFSVKTGGTTSFDITKRGIDKAYGVRRLSEHLSIPIIDMLYVGDALFPGGNDEVVTETGIGTRETSGPEETLRIVEELLA